MPLQFQQMFDARTVEPAAGFELVPAGDYTVRIIESEAKPTKDNTGGKLELKCEILEPAQFASRNLFYNLNLFNPNPQAVEIAYKQLSALCHVTGVFQLQDSRQLHGIPFKVTVSNDGQYNNIKAIKDMNGNMPGKKGTVGSSLPPQAPVAPAPAAPSWPAQPAAAPPQQAQMPWQPPAQAAPVAPAPTAQPPWAAPAPAWQPPQPAAAPPSYAPPQAAAPQMQPAPAAPPWAQPAAAPTWKP